MPLKNLNVISKPVERWFHYEKPILDKKIDREVFWCKDSNGNDVPIFFSWSEPYYCGGY